MSAPSAHPTSAAAPIAAPDAAAAPPLGVGRLAVLSVAVALAYFVAAKGAPFLFPAGNESALLVPAAGIAVRSEEHTSELQSLRHLVCRLLLEKQNYSEVVHRVTSLRPSAGYERFVSASRLMRRLTSWPSRALYFFACVRM